MDTPYRYLCLLGTVVQTGQEYLQQEVPVSLAVLLAQSAYCHTEHAQWSQHRILEHDMPMGEVQESV